MATETKRMRVRQSDSATAKSKNETLRLGEFFYETDTGEIKIGDGVTKYNALLGVRSEAKIAQALASGVYKGQDLSVKFASEIAKYGSVADFLHARCAAGNFEGIYPFDYWYESTGAATIAGTAIEAKSRKCVIAGIDLYYGTGDSGDLVTKHHLTIFAGLSDMNVTFNDINDNNGSTYSEHPWIASKAYAVLNGVNNKGTNKAGTIGFDASSGGFLQIFSSKLRSYMVEQRCHLGKRYSSTATLTDDNGQAWVGRGMLFAPSEIEAYGCMVHSSKATFPQSENYGPFEQFPIFRSAGNNGRLLFGRSPFWLCSVAGGTSTIACLVLGHGSAFAHGTSSTGIRLPLCFHIA